jgi:toxin-antitoxin system PIN domain toxin
MHLLDINILIALGDQSHVHHRRARAWFLSPRCEAWATCPLTENGFIRILGHPSYPDFGGGTEDARSILRALTDAPGHQFWPDDLTLVDEAAFPRLPASKQLTDLYLLALSARRGGQFATLDQRIDSALVPGGASAYFPIPD